MKANKYTDGEKAVIRQFYGTKIWPEVAKLFPHRTPGSLAYIAHHMGVSRKEKRWTMREMQELRNDYGVLTSKELAEKYGVSYNAVRRRAYVWGIEKKV